MMADVKLVILLLIKGAPIRVHLSMVFVVGPSQLFSVPEDGRGKGGAVGLPIAASVSMLGTWQSIQPYTSSPSAESLSSVSGVMVEDGP